MSDLDALLADAPIAPPTFTGAAGKKCGRHLWGGNLKPVDPLETTAALPYPPDDTLRIYVHCVRCGKPKDEVRSRRGKQSRNYGNRAELSASRKYGGTKVGHAGGPVDIRGKDFATQVKTHRRKPPIEWTGVFAALAADNRCPRLLLRFVMGPGVPPADYFVFPADAFLDWFGKDE